MTFQVKHDTRELFAAMDKAFLDQVPYGTMLAFNKTAEQIRSELKTEMDKVFDRPTPWVINSLRIKYATKARLMAEVAFKDKNSVESSHSMLEPHVVAGPRHYKSMEARLNRVGILPSGWNAVPGAAANLDSYGNMSQGQITQLLNVLGTYTEAGYNKANSKTVDRLAKGNKKKGVYGFTYWINPPGSSGPGKHLAPGVYQRVYTGFGTSLKPILMFVKRATYKTRLDFYGIGNRIVERDLANNMRESMAQAISTAKKK